MQLAGYLRGRALLEWNLVSQTERDTYKSAISGLTGIRDVLLYGRLQDGLQSDLVSKAPVISGAQSYKEHCIAAKNEEMACRIEANKNSILKSFLPSFHTHRLRKIVNGRIQEQKGMTRKTKLHFKGRLDVTYVIVLITLLMIGKLTRVSRGRKNWLVRTEDKPIEISTNNFLKIVDSLFPPIEDSVSTVQDKEVMQTTTGTPKSIEVQIEGLPIRGIIDTGSDITILSGTAFQEIVTVCGIKREQFKPPDTTACSYGHQPLKLDGQLDLQVKFGEKSMCERVYIKLDATDALLLSEGMCCKLNIVTYHPDVQSVLPTTDQNKVKKKNNKKARISLIQTVRLPADSSALVQVEVKESTNTTYHMLELDQSRHDTYGK